MYKVRKNPIMLALAPKEKLKEPFLVPLSLVSKNGQEEGRLSTNLYEKLCIDVWQYQIMPFLTPEEALKLRLVCKQAKDILRNCEIFSVNINYLPQKNFVEDVLKPTFKSLLGKFGLTKWEFTSSKEPKKREALISLLQEQRKLKALRLPIRQASFRRFAVDVLPHLPDDLEIEDIGLYWSED